LQSQSLCQFEYYPDDWYRYFQFRLGIFLFAIGFGANLHSDAILRQLRNGSAKYQIPYGGLFEYVSAPHYFGEMIEWTGYALACNSLASLAFLVYAASNLIPRGVAHHAWYRSFFPDYPNERKAIIPFIW
jgi:steroid 5-alpha reductase family enzyme